MSVDEKRQRIQPKHPKLTIQRQCELIGLPRSSYYREGLAGQETPKNLEFMRLIDKEYTDHPFYGTRQIRNVLRRKGYKINRKRVQRLMRKMGIQSIAPKPNTSKAHPQNKVYPYLLRNFDVTRSNQVWSTDITYIPLAGGFVYLTAVIDWHSRYVLSWELSITMDNEFCVSALERALRCHGTPYIFNTDQGSQYTSHEFTNALKKHGIKISMDGKGRCLDNIFIERLWRSVKYEEVYVNEFKSVGQLRKALKKYFDFYNHERPHQSIKAQTPAEVYYGQNQLRMVG
jgi:putative transposase